MPVIVTLKLKGDAAALERYAQENPDVMAAIVDQAKGHGVLAHRFYGNDEGDIMVIDEWNDWEGFQTFFAEAADKIGPMMEVAGVTEQPHPQHWNKLETHDDFGWGA
jgi:hypothetical protein